MHVLSPSNVRAIKLLGRFCHFKYEKKVSLERHILTCVEYFFQAPCYKGKCKYGGHCELVSNTTAQCSCPLCHFRYKPVCGTDRKSYINHCFLRRQACLTKTSILVAQRGRCCKSAFLIYLYSCYSGYPSFQRWYKEQRLKNIDNVMRTTTNYRKWIQRENRSW